eukprot:CAMPEP_0174943354 /NCGR_PEP_ID=MMETSP1355-20121228/76489_1 /TAXON_ID=464990 /ORGANISM="Hemiselmis tepida, Strain CCMP443" /LENGTH=216 /DNA_ID=CAMNT_0016190589 /DNA_START=147 /DNA_END=793 /DNA_ORIENTATION=-
MESPSNHPPLALLKAALVYYNEMTLEEAFEQIANPDDGGEGDAPAPSSNEFMELAQLRQTFQDLELGCDEVTIQRAFEQIDTKRDGKIDMEEWQAALADPEGLEDVLASRGLTNEAVPSEGVPPPKPPNAGGSGRGAAGLGPAAREALNQLGAVLKFNGLTLEEGFEEADVDGDGLVSLADLQAAAESLGIDANEEAIAEVHRAMDAQGDGMAALA